MNLAFSAIIACGLLCAGSGVTLAATPIDQKTMTQYYKNCLARSATDKTMKDSTKTTYCQCTALYFQKNMTMEDVRASVGNDDAARLALNKIVTDVYGPCMEYPVRDLIAGQCAKDINNAKVCNCLSDNMGSYTAKMAQKKLKDILSKSPFITDPMGAILGSPEFVKTQEKIAFSCIQTY